MGLEAQSSFIPFVDFLFLLSCLRGEIPGMNYGDETSLTRDASCEIINIWARKPSVQKVVKRTAGQAGISLRS